MRVAFLGSGRFAIPSLEALVAAGHELAVVVSQPDKPQGRGRSLAPPPLKPVALRLGLPLLQPRRIRDPEAVAALAAARAELHVVVAYGQILPTPVLDIPPRGTINVHASLLPKFRGAAPIQWAIVAGETETGVTTMLLDAGLDTGPLLLQRATPIGPDETAGALGDRLARLGAELLIETLAGWSRGAIAPRPQDPARASHARLLKKEDGDVSWDEPAAVIERKLRGFQPWPGATASVGGRALRLLRARVEPDGPGSPGTVLRLDADGIIVSCGSGSRLRLLELQPESRRAMSAAAFAAGARLLVGDRLA